MRAPSSQSHGPTVLRSHVTPYGQSRSATRGRHFAERPGRRHGRLQVRVVGQPSNAESGRLTVTFPGCGGHV